MPNTRADAYAAIKNKIPLLINLISNLPDCPVWIHERALYKVLKLTSGPTYGQRDVLDCLMRGIEKGFCGNKQKDFIRVEFVAPDFYREDSSGRISWQYNGRHENFSSGSLLNEKVARPRWFKIGEPVTDVATQTAIVEQLLGEACGLPEDVKLRRRDNYMNFMNDADDDGGYSRKDVPTIAYKFRDVWGMLVNTEHVKDSDISSRVFDPNDLDKIEKIMRLMISSCDRYGKLAIQGAEFILQSSVRSTRATGLSAPLVITPIPTQRSTPMPTTRTTVISETTPAVRPSQTALFDTAHMTSSPSSSLVLSDLLVTTEEGAVFHDRIPELASLDLAFDLFTTEKKTVQEIMKALKLAELDLPKSFDLRSINNLSGQSINNMNHNIKIARERLVQCLNNQGPRDDQPLHAWLSDMKRYGEGVPIAANNFELHPETRRPTLSLSAVYLLRHIFYTHNLPLANVLTLWASFHVLILRKSLELKDFICQSTLWMHVMRLHYIDNEVANKRFQPIVNQRTANGFRRYYHFSSDDSNIQQRNRHVLIISTPSKDDVSNLQPSYRHVTSSVSAVKSASAVKNADAIIDMVGLEGAASLAGATCDNAGDAQLEIKDTFGEIMRRIKSSDKDEDWITSMLYENEVLRRHIAYGDPYHVGNLVVTWASIFAFGETEKEDHSQVHHRQLMQSIYSLHADDKNLSQAIMDEVMEGADEDVRVTASRERTQRWLVNQRNAQRIWAMYGKKTKDGVPSLIAWALYFANNSRSTWKCRVGKEIATWLSMPAILLGLHFESELGIYFEEITAWHNRPGPINSRSGFRMMEVHSLYLSFEVPWWNEAVTNPASRIPKTMKFLEDNFQGDEYDFRRGQVMRGLKKGRDELMKMTTRYLLKPPLVFLLLCNRENGASFLRAVLSILHEHPHHEELSPTPLIHEPQSSKWGQYIYTDSTKRPADDKRWYDLISSCRDDIIHWWRQLRFDSACLLRDLQYLSNNTRGVKGKNTAPLLAFKEDFPILFECIYAVFGLMMSHSRLCESVHGMMRHYLRYDIGMDQIDAQRSHMMTTEYVLRERRRKILRDDNGKDDCPKKKMKCSIKHNKTKTQVDLMGVQLVDAAEEFQVKAREILDQPGHGIPSISLISDLGWRHQDKKSLAAQLEAKKKKAEGNTWEELTTNAIKLSATTTALSNDRVMRLGSERLAVQKAIDKMSIQKFWKELPITAGETLISTASKCFPQFKEILGNAEIKATKTAVMKAIGQYLTRVKKTAKLIIEYAYGERGSDKAALKRDRNFEDNDVLYYFKYIRVMELIKAAVGDSAAMAVLSSFQNIDSHYTYTLPPTEEEGEEEDNDEYDETDDEADNWVDVTEEED